jgi:hypothetical protein
VKLRLPAGGDAETTGDPLAALFVLSGVLASAVVVASVATVAVDVDPLLSLVLGIGVALLPHASVRRSRGIAKTSIRKRCIEP